MGSTSSEFPSYSLLWIHLELLCSCFHLPMQEMWEAWVQPLGWEDSPGGGNGKPLQYSCLGNSRDRGAWWAWVHGVIKSWTRLSTWARTRGVPLTGSRELCNPAVIIWSLAHFLLEFFLFLPPVPTPTVYFLGHFPNSYWTSTMYQLPFWALGSTRGPKDKMTAITEIPF